MKLYKLASILTALSLAMFAWGCDLEDDAEDTTGGNTELCGGQTCAAGETCVNDVCTPASTASCTGYNELGASSSDLAGDDFCDQSLFYDVDCADVADDDLSYACGKSSCHFNDGQSADKPAICEAARPCGSVWCEIVGQDAFLLAKPCPNDPDCVGSADSPAAACDTDGHCDTWCPLDNDGNNVDADCAPSDAAYCPGGEKADQCM